MGNKVLPLAQRPMLPETETLLRWLVLALVFCLFLWPSYGEWKMAGVPNLAPPRLLKAAFIFVVILQFFLQRLNVNNVAEIISKNWVFFAMLLAYHAFRVSSFLMDPAASVLFYDYMKNEVFTNLLILFSLLYVINSFEQCEQVIKVLVVVLIPLSALVVVESILRANLFSSIVSDANLGTELALTDKSRDIAYRAHGSFGHPLLLAQYCACIFPVAILVWRRAIGFMKWCALFAACSAIISLLLTNTRSGQVLMFLAILLSLLPLVIRWWCGCKDELKKIFIILNLSIVVAAGAVFFYFWIAELVVGRTNEEAHSSWARWDMLVAAVPKMLASPLIGYGPSHALDGVGFYSRFGRFIDNYFLLVGLQSGLVVACLLLLIFATFIRKMKFKYFTSTVTAGISRGELIAALSSSVLIFLVFQIIHASSELLPLLYILMALILVVESNGECNEINLQEQRW